MSWLGLDVGGANLKAATARGWARSDAFDLWRAPGELAPRLVQLTQEAPGHDGWAVTMTGELADCFATKAEGVAAIVAAVVQAAGSRPVHFYALGGMFPREEAARARPLEVASANWEALARWAGRWVPTGPALVCDIGSTTSDFVPLVDGQVAAGGRNDPERLALGELVYSGVERTPICALVAATRWQGRICAVANEWFATTWDAYLTLGWLPEEPDRTRTADGQPATRAAAHRRLARMVCADTSLFDEADAQALAQAVAQSQLAKLAIGARGVLGRLPGPPTQVVLGGRGEFLARRMLDQLRLAPHIVSLTERLGPEVSACAPAFAVAALADEAPGVGS